MKQVHILTPEELETFLSDFEEVILTRQMGVKKDLPHLPPLIDIPDEKEIEEIADNECVIVRATPAIEYHTQMKRLKWIEGANYILTKLNLK